MDYLKQGRGYFDKKRRYIFENLNPHIWTLYTAEPLYQWMEFSEKYIQNRKYFWFDYGGPYPTNYDFQTFRGDWYRAMSYSHPHANFFTRWMPDWGHGKGMHLLGSFQRYTPDGYNWRTALNKK